MFRVLKKLLLWPISFHNVAPVLSGLSASCLLGAVREHGAGLSGAPAVVPAARAQRGLPLDRAAQDNRLHFVF